MAAINLSQQQFLYNSFDIKTIQRDETLFFAASVGVGTARKKNNVSLSDLIATYLIYLDLTIGLNFIATTLRHEWHRT